MKRTVTLSALLFSIQFLTAQITITTSDMPSVNDTFRISETVDIQSMDPVPTGANYIWNFSALTPQSQRIDTFFSVSSTPIAYQFFFNNIISYPNHKASYALRGRDIGIPQVPITEVFNYIKNSSSAYDNVGFGSKINGLPSSTQNNPVDREYVFPMNYNDNHTSFSEYGITVPGFGHYGQSVERIDTVDGWGSVTTPYGTFNCLRVKSVLHKIDTTYIDLISLGSTIPRPEEIEYKWLAAGKGIPVLKIITTAGVVSSIVYQDSARVVSVPELANVQQVNIYPNPVVSLLNMDINVVSTTQAEFYLTDLTGKEITKMHQGYLTKGANHIVVNVEQLGISPGVYFIKLRSENKIQMIRKVVITN